MITRASQAKTNVPIPTLLQESLPPTNQLSRGTVLRRETLTVEELATVAGIGRTTAYSLASRNALPVPVYRIGSRYVIPRAHVEQWLNKPLDPSPVIDQTATPSPVRTPFYNLPRHRARLVAPSCGRIGR